MCFALEKVYRPKGTFFEELCIEKEPSIRSEHFTVGIFAMSKVEGLAENARTLNAISPKPTS